MALIAPFFVRAEEVRDIVFPLDQEYDYHFTDTYGAARSGGRTHEGTDIMTDKMTPVLAVVDGKVTEVVDHDEGWGLAIYIKDTAGYSYRYLHINNDTPGTDDNKDIRAYAFPKNIKEGVSVTAGQVIAFAGDSGNAENAGSHLHFEIWTPDRESINSYPSLMAAIGKPVAASGNAESAGYQFTRDLELGDEGADVKELQKYLNQAGFVVASSGAGSAGHETTYFGPATQSALIKFQKAKNISPSAGYFGPKTRAYINANNVITAKAGWLVKDKLSPKVYHVSDDLELEWIVSEAAAIEHFGADWYLDIKEFDDLADLDLPFGDYIL